MLKIIYVFIFSVCAVLPAKAQDVYCAGEDSLIFERFLQYSQQGDRSIIHTAQFFMGAPYVSGTLEGDSVERLRVNLRELDCFTLVENVIALYLMLQGDDRSFDNFCTHLQRIRYRNGILNGYLSRLHYTSEWIDYNNRKGILNLPKSALSNAFAPNVSFMSSHCDLYPALKTHPSWCAEIRQTEDHINQLQLFYIRKEQVKNAANDICDGDMIAITTHIKGLDVAHVGFALVRNGKIFLFHASSETKKVIVSGETLYEYLMNRKNHSGIIVARIR